MVNGALRCGNRYPAFALWTTDPVSFIQATDNIHLYENRKDLSAHGWGLL